tara:strand:- start:360 stop:587 length:228 start_codon:yes stop_codon:yes gene_type:complete
MAQPDNIEEFSPGWFLVPDLPHLSVFDEALGHTVAPHSVMIPPTVSSATLRKIIDLRKPKPAKKKAAAAVEEGAE